MLRELGRELALELKEEEEEEEEEYGEFEATADGSVAPKVPQEGQVV